MDKTFTMNEKKIKQKILKNRFFNIQSMNFPLVFIFFLIIQISFIPRSYSQAVVISGKVTASRFPVQDAQLTFIDNSDTTKKFTALTDNTGNYSIDIVTSIKSNANNAPVKFNLGQSYPNPFSSTAAIPYGLNKVSNVEIIIYDILGRVVREFEVGQQSAGTHNVLWDGSNNFGHQVASGIYFYKMKADGESQVKKMIYNQNSHGLVALPRSFSLTENSSPAKTGNIKDIYGNIFTVRVQNTNVTSPLIVPVELENVVIQNDTTINFSMSYIPAADINFDSLHQIIRGFGAANIVGWRPDMTDDEIETAFGTGDGQIGFTILRLRVQPDSNQWNINVPTAKKAYDMGVTIVASPWSPPASMKTNNSLVSGELREDAYDDFAAHLDSFAEYMSDNGVPVYAVSVQNEPDIEVSYESCDYSPEQMLKFMRENADSVGTLVMAPESFQFRRNMSDPILNDSLASENLDIVAGHIYGGGLASYPLAREKGKEVWMTEHLTASGETENPLSIGLAIEIAEEMNSVMNAGMSAYIWWYIVRFYGPISDGTNNSGNKGEVTKKGYVMSQFARFIRPGYYRIESSVNPSLSDVNVTAYKDPETSKMIIVAVNSGSSEVEQIFRIQSGTLNTTFTPYTTNIALNCEEGVGFSVNDDNFSYKLLPLSITTFVSD